MINSKLYSKHKEIINHAEERIFQFKANKPSLDRLFYQSILFYRGEQWITFDLSTLRFRRTNQRRVIPRPITNKFAPICNGLISAFSRYDPKITVAPETDSFTDIQTAYAGNRIIKTIENEVNWDKRKTELLPWLVLCGNAYLITGFAPEEGKRQTMVKVQCPQCGLNETRQENRPNPDCPRCASIGLKSPMKDQIDQRSGKPITTQEAQGKLVTEVATPFEMFLDTRVQDLQAHQSIGRITTKDVTWARHNWPEVEDKIAASKRMELNARILNALASITFPQNTYNSNSTVDVVEFWEKPCKEYPDGFYIVYSGQDIVHELYPFSPAFTSNSGEPFFPIVHFPYDKVPGTLLARTPAFDLIDRQKTRNRVEAIGETILMRMSNPVWVVPKPGTDTVITGHVGQQIAYDPHQTGNIPPQRIEGSKMSPGVIAWLDRLDRDMSEIAAQSEIQRGERPLSVKSGYAIGKLQEIADNRNTGPFTNYAIAIAEWQMQAFELFRKVTPQERYARILGDDKSAWTVQKIQEADMSGGIDIWAEPGGVLPKTHLERLATLEMLIQTGLVNVQDPLVQLKIHREYGLSDILPSLDADDQYIAREQDRWKQGGQMAVSPFDNDSLHIQRHLDLYKSEYFEGLQDPQQKQALMQHITEHMQSAADKQAQAAEQAAAVPPPQPQLQQRQQGGPR